jgi:hypothetical protein
MLRGILFGRYTLVWAVCCQPGWLAGRQGTVRWRPGRLKSVALGVSYEQAFIRVRACLRRATFFKEEIGCDSASNSLGSLSSASRMG